MYQRNFAAAAILTLIVLASCSAPHEAVNDWKTHEIDAEYPDLSQVQIRTGIERWIPELFQKANVVITQSKTETGRISAEGIWTEATEYAPSLKADIQFTLTIDVEDEEAQYRLTKLKAVSCEDKTELAPVTNSRIFHEDAEARFQSMVAKLSTAITAKAADW